MPSKVQPKGSELDVTPDLSSYRKCGFGHFIYPATPFIATNLPTFSAMRCAITNPFDASVPE
jgi:hypothetical protein